MRRQPAGIGARAGRMLFAFAVVVGGLALPGRPAEAHTPHDDVFAIAVSPRYEEDRTAIVVARGFLYRTTDGTRTWDRLTVGLTHRAPLGFAAVTCCEAPVFLVASESDGVYRSDDGGSSWARSIKGLASTEVSRLVASPVEGGPVFAVAGRALYRSDDAGRRWKRLSVPGADITSIGVGALDGDEVLVGDAEGAIHRSLDRGARWTTTEVEGAGVIGAVARRTRGEVLIGSDRRGLLRANGDLGRARAVEGVAGAGRSVSSIAVGTGGDPTIWVSLADVGPVRSDDGGVTWTASADGLTKAGQADAPGYEDRPHFGDLVRAPSSADGDATVLLAGFDGLFVLDGGAARWREAELMGSRIVVGLAVSPSFAVDGTVIVTTYMNGASRSTDGGATWTSINEGIEEPVLAATAPDRFARMFGVAFSPAYPEDGTVVAGRWTDLLRSDGRGASWSPVAVVPGPDPPLQQFVLAPGPPGAGPTFLAGARSGAIHRSIDGGRTFEQVGAIDGSVRTIVAVGGAEAPGRYLVASFRGVFATDDGGVTWRALAGSPRTVTNVAASPSFTDDGIAFAATRGGLFVTRDGGRTWSRHERPALRGLVEGVAVSPAYPDDGVVLVAMRGQGMFRSSDGGETFVSVADGLADEQLEVGNYSNATSVPIVFSPAFADDQTVFGFADDEVLRSTDGGRRWRALDVPTAIQGVSAPAPAPAPTPTSTSTSAPPPTSAPTPTPAPTPTSAPDPDPAPAVEDPGSTGSGTRALVALSVGAVVLAVGATWWLRSGRRRGAARS